MNTLSLPSVCDRAAAREILPELRDAIASSPLAIDASKVEKVGQAMLQVLLSASGTEGGITLHSPSNALIEALRLTDLQDSLAAEMNEEPAQ
ncbi:MAG: STAS domain-containing protein [Pseudomonadota bacterium]